MKIKKKCLYIHWITLWILQLQCEVDSTVTLNICHLGMFVYSGCVHLLQKLFKLVMKTEKIKFIGKYIKYFYISFLR